MQFNLLVKNNNKNKIICYRYVKKQTNKHLHVLKAQASTSLRCWDALKNIWVSGRELHVGVAFTVGDVDTMHELNKAFTNLR